MLMIPIVVTRTISMHGTKQTHLVEYRVQRFNIMGEVDEVRVSVAMKQKKEHRNS